VSAPVVRLISRSADGEGGWLALEIREMEVTPEGGLRELAEWVEEMSSNTEADEVLISVVRQQG